MGLSRAVALVTMLALLLVLARTIVHSSIGGELFFASDHVLTCDRDMAPDHGAPSRRVDATCCLLCGGDFSEKLVLRNGVTIVQHMRPPAFAIMRIVGRTSPPSSRLMGWATSWSSQAPPSLS